MPLFKCEECGCVENTALCGYWSRELNDDPRALCSGCDPNIGEWHGRFDKRNGKGMLIGENGFLYSEKPAHTKIVGMVE